MTKDEFDKIFKSELRGPKPQDDTELQQGVLFELLYGPLDGALGVRCLAGIAIFGLCFRKLKNGYVLSGNMEMPDYLCLPWNKKMVSYRYQGDYSYEFERYVTDGDKI